MDKGDGTCFVVSISKELTAIWSEGTPHAEHHKATGLLKLTVLDLTEQHRLMASVIECLITTFACISK